MGSGSQSKVTPFVGGPVFPNTNLTATPGSASASVEWTDVADVTVAAPITVAADNTIGHAASGVTPGTYGDATHIPEVTVEADGHVTAVTVGAAVAPIASPAFTGTPTAPTAPALTDDTQIATTAYADSAVGVEKTRAEAAEALLAPLASPALTGTPTTPTNATATDSSTQIATDAFVQAAIAHFGFLPKAGGTMTGTIVLDGVTYTLTLVNDANYTLTSSDMVVIWTAITAIRFLEIPSGLPVGQTVLVADGSGNVSAGSREIQLDFLTGVTGNGNSNCCYTFINQPYGQGTVVCRASNAYIYNGNSWPLWLPSSSSVTYGGGAALGGTWNFNSGSTAIFNNASIQITPTVQSISGTLTLNNKSPNFQSINGGAADRTVNLPFTGGDWYFIQNSGTTNNLLITTNSATVYSLPPGRSGLFVNTSSGVGGSGAQYRVLTDAARLLLNVDLTAQAAAQSGTALYTAPSNGAGMYRVSYAAVITQAATSSSTLGGFSVTYTDNDTGASVTTPVGPTSSANTVGTQLSGSVLVNAKVSTAITFSFGYASSGATPMQYAIHVRSEYLG